MGENWPASRAPRFQYLSQVFFVVYSSSGKFDYAQNGLAVYGCDVAQGFYYSPPITAPALLDLLTCCPDPSYGCSN